MTREELRMNLILLGFNANANANSYYYTHNGYTIEAYFHIYTSTVSVWSQEYNLPQSTQFLRIFTRIMEILDD